ncbi:MAG: two-component system response regulator [Nitrospiraceae bacterium]
MKQKILFVDDEPNVLNGLRRTPPSLEQEWGIAFATSGQEALAILSQDSYDVIITDMRMPDMDGGRLLSEVRVRHPHVVRVLLSDQSDLEAVLRSVSSAHQCLSKSCTPDLLRATVARACAVRDLLANDALRKLVSGMQTLPSLPALYREVMEELQSPDASIEKVGRIIAKDMGMVTKILQLVNSPFYGLRTHISSATQAVALLGLDTIKSLVLSMKVFSQFEGAHQSFFSLEVLWNHGMMVGRCAQIIAKEQGVDQRIMEDAFTAGLLHDVGLLVLATNLPTQYTDTLALIQDRGIPEWEAEREVLGATHGDIGGDLLGIWGLSDTIVEAVAFHHEPSRSVGNMFSPLTAVHVANVVEEEEVSAGMGGPPVTMDVNYLSACGLSGKLPIWRALCRGLSQSRSGVSLSPTL